jgi:hypothetical protein
MHICFVIPRYNAASQDQHRQICSAICKETLQNRKRTAHLFAKGVAEKSVRGIGLDRCAEQSALERGRTWIGLYICPGKASHAKMYVGSALQMCTPKRRRLRQSHFDLFSDTDHQSYLTQSHANGWKTEKLSLKTRNMTLEKRNPQENSDGEINFAKKQGTACCK